MLLGEHLAACVADREAGLLGDLEDYVSLGLRECDARVRSAVLLREVEEDVLVRFLAGGLGVDDVEERAAVVIEPVERTFAEGWEYADTSEDISGHDELQ